MPPKKEQKTKEQKLAAALAGSKKSKKKKWAKGRVKEKKNNASIVLPDEYATAIKEIPRMKTITVATVSEKYRIKGSLAYRLIMKLNKDGVLTKVVKKGGFLLYKKSWGQIQKEAEAAKKKEEEAAEKKKAADKKEAERQKKAAAKKAKKAQKD